MAISIPTLTYKTLVRKKSNKVISLPQNLKVFRITQSWHGYGSIAGFTKKIGMNYPKVTICVFQRSTKALLWETKSKTDGSYAFQNIAMGLECFVIAFDPSNQYNAVIQDKVVAK